MAAYIVQSTVQHEYIHQLIFEKYGINSTVTYNFWNATKKQFNDVLSLDPLAHNDISEMEAWAWTTPDNNTNFTCNETCEMLHTQQEIADSQTGNIVMVMFVVLLLYVLYNEFFSNKKDELGEVLDERLEYVFKEEPLREDSRFDIEV